MSHRISTPPGSRTRKNSARAAPMSGSSESTHSQKTAFNRLDLKGSTWAVAWTTGTFRVGTGPLVTFPAMAGAPGAPALGVNISKFTSIPTHLRENSRVSIAAADPNPHPTSSTRSPGLRPHFTADSRVSSRPPGRRTGPVSFCRTGFW